MGDAVLRRGGSGGSGGSDGWTRVGVAEWEELLLSCDLRRT